MVFRICGTLIIYYKIWVMADVSVVVESDFIRAMMYRIMVIERINILFYGLMICLISFKELDVFLRLI